MDTKTNIAENGQEIAKMAQNILSTCKKITQIIENYEEKYLMNEPTIKWETCTKVDLQRIFLKCGTEIMPVDWNESGLAIALDNYKLSAETIVLHEQHMDGNFEFTHENAAEYVAENISNKDIQCLPLHVTGISEIVDNIHRQIHEDIKSREYFDGL